MIHRLISVPLTLETFQKEVSLIKYLARIYHINLDIDSSMICKKLTTRAMDTSTSLPIDKPKEKMK